jgi:hypothetical protein
VLKKNPDLRWDDAVRMVLGKTVGDVRAEKQKVKEASGNFTQDEEDNGEE